ncbi:type II toxin-antitoxin system HipA family toxin [Flavisphingomonas formosensis]|uniref:type II toxin-antitoxin system HipA family toxin n=1 Tax=Flavisphingomonas formosensis TaxID=861534 RepID=UPI0012F7E5CD|nr:type II toxin-antitoxin system HipA family toxin [Sphingomonas formosensis]
MTETRALDIHLGTRKVGTIVALDGERTIFSFAEDYVGDAERPTLSLGYRDAYGALINEPRAHRVRLEPFFSNLLPEGALKEYLARRAGVKAVREFQLLAALGGDLPGAVRAVPTEAAPENIAQVSEVAAAIPERFRFSLAGVQLKFSALKNQGKKGGLTIAVSGDGCEWIVKLPSTNFANVPENEYSIMTLARLVGIDVPEIELLSLAAVEGLPEGIEQLGDSAFAIRRFDRSPEGRIHIEDFAQVFGVYPDDKYEKASYRNILAVLADATDDQSIDQFTRRLTFSVLVGNGDMHLKNWSLIYPDGKRPILSPAYDLLSTVPYLPGEQSALKFRRSKEWSDFNEDTLVRLADKARIAATPVLKAARETVERFDTEWAAQKANLPLPARLIDAIEKHRGGLAL